jgi:hypothetical protein
MDEIGVGYPLAQRGEHDRYVARRILRGAATIAATACLLATVSCSRSASRPSRTSRDGDLGTQVVRHEPVLMLPRITGGEGGWCVTLYPGVCPTANPVRAVHDPIIAESWSGHGLHEVDVGFVLTTGEVAAVSVDGGRSIPTHAESVLTDNLRTAVVELRGGPLRHVPGFNVNVRAVPLGSLRFTPLNSKGDPIPQAINPRAPLSFYLPGRGWVRPASAPPGGVCEIRTRHLAGLVAPAGFVVTRVIPHTGLIGQPFVSCASNSYSFEGWSLVASILLDAARPGSTPSALPVMKPLSGHPGRFEMPVAEGQAVARRIPGAWLVVARGRDDTQRLAVLEQLRATVHL